MGVMPRDALRQAQGPANRSSRTGHAESPRRAGCLSSVSATVSSPASRREAAPPGLRSTAARARRQRATLRLWPVCLARPVSSLVAARPRPSASASPSAPCARPTSPAGPSGIELVASAGRAGRGRCIRCAIVAAVRRARASLRARSSRHRSGGRRTAPTCAPPPTAVIAFAGDGRRSRRRHHRPRRRTRHHPRTGRRRELAVGQRVEQGRARSAPRRSAGTRRRARSTSACGCDGEYINPLLLLGALPRAVLLPCCD